MNVLIIFQGRFLFRDMLLYCYSPTVGCRDGTTVQSSVQYKWWDLPSQLNTRSPRLRYSFRDHTRPYRGDWRGASKGLGRLLSAAIVRLDRVAVHRSSEFASR